MGNDSLFQGFPSSTQADWQQKAEKDLKGKPFQKTFWNTFEGFALPPFFNQESLGSQELQKLIPGQYPYNRSHKELSNGWLIREEIAALKNIKVTNSKAHEAVQSGSHNLVFAIKANDDGFDGIPVESQSQLETLLEGIDPQNTGISIKSGDLSPYYLSLLAKWARNSETKQVFGGLDYDPLSTLAIEGKTHGSMEHVFQSLKQNLALANEHLPLYKVVTIHSRTFHNAGASAVQELAFTLSMAHEYIHQLGERRLTFDDFYHQFQMEMSVGGNYFTEIAKLRAMRWLWTTLTSQFTSNTENQALYLIGKTSEWNKAVYDPNVNMLRSTTESMSAVLGGADEVEVDPYDKSFRKPNAFSERIARNLHHLLTHESHLDKVVDPGAGSYYIENLTQSLATHAWELFQEVEEKGGYLAALQSGWIQSELKSSRKKREDRLAKRKEKYIGVNEYPNPADNATDIVEPSKPRFPLPEVAEGDVHISNSMEASNIAGFTLHHLKADGETVDKISHYAATEAFEQLRAWVEMKKKQGQKVPSVYIMALGNRAMRSARTNFALNFYGVAGLDIINPGGFDTVDEAMAHFTEQPGSTLVLCSSDDEYEALLPLVTKGLSKHRFRPEIVLAGHPGDKREDYEDMGVEGFIYMGCDLYEELKSIVK